MQTWSNPTKDIMKITLKLFTLLVAAGFMLSSCEGPMGPSGVDGKDGLDGKDANTSCLKCHTMANQNAKTTEFNLSAHYSGNPRTGKYCARCHSNEGFQEIIENKKYIVSNDMPNARGIECETCHKHTGFDFTVDTISEILRTNSPVFLNYRKNVVSTDFGKINNLCTNCHQIRGPGNAYTTLPFFPFDYAKLPTDPVEYRLGASFSVHDGNQSNLFAGINGYEYAGETYVRTWDHSTNSCTDCHMNKYNPADSTGGHTFKVNLNDPACNTCHNLASKINTTKTLIDLKIKELGDILVTKKVFKSGYSAVNTHDYNGLLFDGTTTTQFTKIEANTTVSPTTGLVVYGTKLTLFYDTPVDAATRIGRTWKYGELGAAYNYGYIKSESPSGNFHGVHNSAYALKLLQESIDWLNAN